MASPSTLTQRRSDTALLLRHAGTTGPRLTSFSLTDSGTSRQPAWCLCPQRLETVRPRPPPITFREYALDYLSRLIGPNRETLRKYRERLEIHVFPAFGDRPIAEITRREIREWQTSLADKLSPKTIANIRGETVVPIFNAACLPGEDEEPPLRSYNPVLGLKLPPMIRPERDILESPEEARIFIAAAYAIDVEAAELLVTTLATGLRWGEVAGLPPRAVHPSRGTLSIRQVLRKEHGKWSVIQKPKTKQGYREVPVHDEIMEILERRCRIAGRNFVFTAPKGNHWRYDNFYWKRWVKIRDLAEANGLQRRMTPHGLRHSLLTLLATEGIDLEGLRQIAGHKRISTTFDVYVHHTRKHHEPVKKVVTGFFGTGLLPHASGAASAEPL